MSINHEQSKKHSARGLRGDMRGRLLKKWATNVQLLLLNWQWGGKPTNLCIQMPSISKNVYRLFTVQSTGTSSTGQVSEISFSGCVLRVWGWYDEFQKFQNANRMMHTQCIESSCVYLKKNQVVYQKGTQTTVCSEKPQTTAIDEQLLGSQIWRLNKR
jgi:hypothetical protein